MSYLLSGDFILLALAAFFAGTVNALAGGGTFLTLPALVFIGVPPVMANTTSAAALLPGYLGASFGYLKTLKTIQKDYLFSLLLVVMAASVMGAFLLINTPNETFLKLIPWLLLIATGLFMINPYLKKYLSNSSSSGGVVHNVGILIVGTYGGYFNGGLGIALLSALSLNKKNSLEEMIALKSVLSFFLTAVSVLFFTINGFIVWWAAVSMMAFSTIGGFFGATMIQRLSSEFSRILIICIGISMTILMFTTS